MFKKIKSVLNRWIKYKHRDSAHRDLDFILASAQENKKLENILSWLVKLLQWIRYERPIESQLESETVRVQITRLRYLFMILDRNPIWKQQVALQLRAVIHEVSGLEFYTETGLPKELNLWSELSNRMMMKILPKPPLDQELVFLFWELFPNKNDSLWLAAIDEPLFQKIIELFNYEIDPNEKTWNLLITDLEDALMYLVIQVRAIGLSPSIRRRFHKQKFRESAFFKLLKYHNDFQTAYSEGQIQLANEKGSDLHTTIQDCRQEIDQVYKHLDEYGVSIDLVFQMTKIKIYLQRIDSLIDILICDKLDSRIILEFLSKLVKENQELRSIGSLISQNISLMARKVSERTAKTGEHYITRTKEEYYVMLRSAAGGGAIIAIAVYIKIGIVSMGISGFIEGFLVSLCYAVSFVVIHLAGFTIGTKQPAMTAPALASKMQNVNSARGIEDLIIEIIHLIRSQVASILGNILLVIPTVILIDICYRLIFGNHLFSQQKAEHIINDNDIFGPSIIYAVFTGVLLWLSSIIAGWSDNWYALNSMRKRLSRSPSLMEIFGKRGALRIAVFFDKNLSGLLGNISFGLFLGMIPAIMKFIGIPLDIRHVTVSAGSVAGAILVLNFNSQMVWEFIRAAIGIFFIGAFNVLISFGLALVVALKARGIETPQRRAIRKVLKTRLILNPLSFILPLNMEKSWCDREDSNLRPPDS